MIPSRIPYVSEQATKFILERIPSDERIVITGASGWLGRTLVSMLRDESDRVLCLGSHSRWINQPTAKYRVHQYDVELVKAFGPTLLVDFASLTREKTKVIGSSTYLRTNRELLSTAREILRLDTVRAAIFTSSGAAEFARNLSPSDPIEPYSQFKLETESSFQDDATALGKRIIGLRPWSLSGPLVTEPSLYAFSSIMQQAINGQVSIFSGHLVYRRYISVDDLLAVGFGLLGSPRLNGEILDSGGELIEIQSLADMALDYLEMPKRVFRSLGKGEETDRYYSDNSSWEKAIDELGYTPETLSEQVARTIEGLKAREQVQGQSDFRS